MNHEDAVVKLTSDSSHERLKAARYFGRSASAQDASLLRRARQTETVSYVKLTLDAALARLANVPSIATTDSLDEVPISGEVKRQIWNQAVEWIAGLLLHEIGSSIGLVKRSASREFPNYESSLTKRRLEDVQRVFESVEQLKSAAAIPRPQEFDLAELLRELVSLEAERGHIADVSLVGPSPMVITSDPALLRLAISNGIRNALEAVSTLAIEEPHPVVMTWGMTDIDHWVAIVDKGPGIVGPSEAAFGIGKTTKSGHSGFGLAIARRAIETLGGTVVLEPAAQGGARYEARWER